MIKRAQSLEVCSPRDSTIRNTAFEDHVSKNCGSFDETMLVQNPECAVCIQPVEQEEGFVQLKCSKQRILHTNCFHSWVNKKKKCPLCNATKGSL